MKTILEAIITGILVLAVFWGLSLMACSETNWQCGDDIMSQTILKIIKQWAKQGLLNKKNNK